VAEAVGVSVGQFSRWVNDEVLPKGTALVRLPGILNVDGHWLLTGEGEMVRPASGEAEWRVRRVRDALEEPYVSQSAAGVERAKGAAGSLKAAKRGAQDQAS
jgi:transcriptional regulator with XRE-family HTH domain